MRRLLSFVVVVGVVLSLAGAGSAAQAGTLAQSTSCSLTSVVTFSPGLTLSEQFQTVGVRGKLNSCNGGGVASAKVKGKGSGSLSCTSGTATAKLTLKWNTGETSKVKVTIDVSASTFAGKVKSGKFAGEAVTASVSVSPIDGDCFFTPVTKAEVDGTVGV
jgi:hypothetical protein